MTLVCLRHQQTETRVTLQGAYITILTLMMSFIPPPPCAVRPTHSTHTCSHALTPRHLSSGAVAAFGCRGGGGVRLITGWNRCVRVFFTLSVFCAWSVVVRYLPRPKLTHIAFSAIAININIMSPVLQYKCLRCSFGRRLASFPSVCAVCTLYL